MAKSYERDPQPQHQARPTTLTIDNTMADVPVEDAPIFVGAVQVDGAPDIALAALAAASDHYIGHDLSSRGLKDLLGALSGVARSQGFLFARSTILPQTLAAGVLRVRLDEGQIDRIDVIGAASAAVQATLAPLVGNPARRTELERRLMLVSDLPGIRMGKVRYALENGQGVLSVSIRADRVSASVSVDNWGLHGSGPVRTEWELNINRVLNGQDALNLELVETPENPSQLNFLWGRYAMVLPKSGVELAISGSYGRTRSERGFDETTARGVTHSLGATATAPLIRSRKASLWLSAAVENFAVNQTFGLTPARRDRLTTARASLNGYLPLVSGRLRVGAGITHGLNVFGATHVDDPLASRAGASADFALIDGWANWTGRIKGPVSARLAIYAQISTKPLLAFEQISIGGFPFGRAYDFSERTGDEGVLSSAELRATIRNRSKGALRSAQLYAFGDASRVSDHRTSLGTGSLFSTGGGARLNFEELKLEVEAAFPIKEARYASHDRSPRVRFSITKAF